MKRRADEGLGSRKAYRRQKLLESTTSAFPSFTIQKMRLQSESMLHKGHNYSLIRSQHHICPRPARPSAKNVDLREDLKDGTTGLGRRRRHLASNHEESLFADS
jgi:hypothetical protein